jgi:lipooligosaccharide transport system permease protein
VLATRILERDLRVLGRLWHSWVFSAFVMPALFLAAMGMGLGGVIDEHRGSVAGLSYLEFVAPGLLVAAVMQQAAAESLWPVLGGVKWDRHYFAMIATPLAPRDLHLGVLAYIGLRSAVSAAAFLVVAALLGGIVSPWAVLALPAAVLCALAFAAPMSAFSITQDTDVVLSMLMRLGIMPVFLFSGTFFPVSVLPTWLQAVPWISPLWHGVELARHAATGDAHAADVVHVLVLLAVIAAGGAWGRRAFTRRLTP